MCRLALKHTGPDPAEERKLKAWRTLTPCIRAGWKCSDIRRPHISEAATTSTTHTEETHLSWVHRRGIRLWQTCGFKFGGPKRRLGKPMGSWCSSLQAAGTWWKLLRERTGQVLGNWTQKEGQLSITHQCMEFNFKKAELRVSCLNIST